MHEQHGGGRRFVRRQEGLRLLVAPAGAAGFVDPDLRSVEHVLPGPTKAILVLPFTEKDLRASFVNASRKEVGDIGLPTDFETIDWTKLDFLGWRDPKIGRRSYIVVPTLDDALIGVLLRQAEASPRSRAQCSWCQDVKLPNDVVFYSAKRSGPSGRNGNTVGTLVCESFQCSQNVRRLPPPAYEGYDVEAARGRRIEELQLRTASFAAAV